MYLTRLVVGWVLFGILVIPSRSFSCPPLSKLAIHEMLAEKLGPAYRDQLPDFEIDFDHGGIKILKPYLGTQHKDWYAYSISLPKEGVDSIYAHLARKTGEEVVLGGGSDLIEVGLLRTSKQASLAEINLVMEKHLIGTIDGIDKMWQFIPISVPAFKGRQALENATMSINGESGINISAMVENSDKGKHLIGDFFPLSVPFKHGHAVVVKKDGSARLFFRTIKDLENYTSKTLTLPDEDHFPKDWHLQKTNNGFLVQTLKYHMNVYARAKPLGWRYSSISKDIIHSWGTELKKRPKEIQDLRKLFLNGAKDQDVSENYALSIWKEFGFE